MMKNWKTYLGVLALFVFAGFVFSQAQNSQEQVRRAAAMDKLNYLDYSEANFLKSKENGKTVLFFAATLWCQSCIETEEEIISRASEIPDDVTILKVDYDNDKETGRKYQVTMQDTLVLLDSEGNELSRWVGGGFDALLKNVNRSS